MPRLFHLYRDAFRGLPREVWLVSAAALVNRAGMMVLPFLSLYLRESKGFTPEAISWILLGFGLGSAVGNGIAGRLIDRFGALAVQNASLISGGAAFLCIPLLDSQLELAAGTFVAAALADAFRPACMASTSLLAPDAVRTRALALLRLAVNVGMAIGPAAGGLLAGIDYRWIFVAEALTCWAAAVVLMVSLRGVIARDAEPADAEGTGARPARISPIRDARFLMLLGLVFLLSMAFFQVFHVMPLYLKDVYGFAEQTIGLMLGFNAFLIVMMEMPIVHALERRDPWIVFGLGGVLVGGGLALMPLGHGHLYLVGTVVVWSLGEMLSLPFSNALVASQGARARATGRYMGLYGMTFALASILAPFVGLRVYGTLGGDVLWYGAGVAGAGVLCGSLVMSATRARRIRAQSS